MIIKPTNIRIAKDFVERFKMADSTLSTIPSELIRSELFKVVEDILKTKNYTVNVCAGSKEGENNFLGIVYRVTFANKDEKAAKPSKLILKVAPQNEARRALFKSRLLCLREIYMYDVVSKIENQNFTRSNKSSQKE